MLIALGIILIAAALHPFVTYPLTLTIWRRLRPVRSQPGPKAAPAISILCCARNEESVIAAKARNCLDMAGRYPGRAEILFYLDACTDGTVAALEPYLDSITIIEGAEPAGKSVGMGRLVASAGGEILVFTDANTMAAPDALAAFADHFRDVDVGCVCSFLSITNGGESETARVNGIYWRLEETIRLLESETGSSMTADGALFAIRAALYVPTPPDIIDDMHTSMNVLLSGARMVASRTVLAQERTASDQRDEFTRKMRIACRAFNCYRLLAPRLHRAGPEVLYKFYSHKVLRWLSLSLAGLGGALLVAGLVLTGQVQAAAALIALGLGTLSLGALGLPFVSRVWEVFLAHVAVTAGVMQSLRGERHQTWAPLPSGRAMTPPARPAPARPLSQPTPAPVRANQPTISAFRDHHVE